MKTEPLFMPGSVDIVRTFVPTDTSPVDYHHWALSYWEERRGGRFAPAWRDISLMDFPPTVIPLMSVTDIIAEPLSSKYRFWGTRLTQVFGGDYTGQPPNVVPPRALGLSKTGGCGRLVNERAPHLEVKEFQTVKGILGRAIVLRLPLSDDGEAVDHGVNVYYFEPGSDIHPQSDFFAKIFASL